MSALKPTVEFRNVTFHYGSNPAVVVIRASIHHRPLTSVKPANRSTKPRRQRATLSWTQTTDAMAVPND